MARSIRTGSRRGHQIISAVSNSALPAPTGTAQVGQTLTAAAGTWGGTPTPHLVSRQWVRGASTDIPGATGATYLVTGADTGQTIKVRVMMSNSIHDLTVTSAATAAVIA